MKTYFISGIDTDIGKTVAVGMLARHLRNSGVRVVTVKLVQTGNNGFSEDLEKHRKLMGIDPLPEDREGLTAPAIFRFPASPHLAAKLENRTLDLNAIRAAVRELENRFDVVLLEGAGGLAVPLTEDLLTVDFAAEQKYPLILVTSGKLGSLNHTILSIEAATRRCIRIAGVVYNWSPEADPVIDTDSERMIRKYLLRYGQPEVVVRLPRVSEPLPEIDFSAIFEGVRP